jgi:hypothetical protein
MKACGLTIPNAPRGVTCARRRGHSRECRGINPNERVYVHFFARRESSGGHSISESAQPGKPRAGQET